MNEKISYEANKKTAIFKRISLIAIGIVLFVSGILASPMILGNSTVLDSDAYRQKLSEILDIMDSKWYFSKTLDDPTTYLMDKAYYGMTQNTDIDPHTTYMSTKEVSDFMSALNNEYVGIGVQFFNTGENTIITRVFKESPAEKAGILPGDIIYKVNGEDLTGYTSDKLVEIVRGEANTTMTMIVLRNGEQLQLQLTRAPLHNSIYSEQVDEHIGYIEINSFSDGTGEEFYEHLTKMPTVSKLIIDLRDNGGGYLGTLSKILNYLLDKGTVIMQEEFVDGQKDQIKTSGGKIDRIKQIVILINENSASASEVMTLALSEKGDNVTVIGKKSYGKGTVQTTQFFDDDSAIKYTIAKWLSPNGVSIDREGITPDIEVLQPNVYYFPFPAFEDEESYTIDQVNAKIAFMQEALSFLGYFVDRTDGYFDNSSYEALMAFEQASGLQEQPYNKQVNRDLYTAVVKKIKLDKSADLQYQAALEYLND